MPPVDAEVAAAPKETDSHIGSPSVSSEHATLREVVETLAPLERRAGSRPEQEAAEWIAARLERAGARARIEDVQFLDGYAPQLLPLGMAGVVAGGLAMIGRGRTIATGLGAAAAAAIADDAANGVRVWRRAVTAPRTTWNVVAEAGDRDADRTLVVLAHHDAAPTGRVFDQSAQVWFAGQFPELVESLDTSPPLWWLISGGPALSALGALLGKRRLAACRSHPVSDHRRARGGYRPEPGHARCQRQPERCRGAGRDRRAPARGPDRRGPRVARLLRRQGGIQGGIYGFAERYFPQLDRERTWFLNLDTIGSPQLIMLEGEGPFVMEDYPRAEFRDLIARVAETEGVQLRRGQRSRTSTDSVIPARAGYAIATLASFEHGTKVLSNYHLMSDIPENLDYGTIAEAVSLTCAVAAELAHDA